jgi:uncharacterized DUF497 family protein
MTMLFQWDEAKRQANLTKHLIDSADATRIFDGPVFEKAQRPAWGRADVGCWPAGRH